MMDTSGNSFWKDFFGVLAITVGFGACVGGIPGAIFVGAAYIVFGIIDYISNPDRWDDGPLSDTKSQEQVEENTYLKEPDKIEVIELDTGGLKGLTSDMKTTQQLAKNMYFLGLPQGGKFLRTEKLDIMSFVLINGF